MTEPMTASAALRALRGEMRRTLNSADQMYSDGLLSQDHVYRWANELDAILRSLPDEPASEGWQSIATAPKDGTVVLLWWRDEYGGETVDVMACGCWREYGDGSRGWMGESFYATEPAFWTRLLGEQPTHWMPLPPAPRQEGQ